MPTILKVGDEVESKWGRAKVANIERLKEPGDKYGSKVAAMSWSLIEGDYAVVDLDNGHWAHGSQISPVKE